MATLVRHLMAEELARAKPDMSAADAAGLMRQFDVGVIPVLDGDEFLGIVTDRDLVTRVVAQRQDPQQVKLSDVMTEKTVTISPDASLTEAEALMTEHQIRRLPVVKEGRLMGMLSMGDVAVHVASKRSIGETLAEVSRSPATEETAESGPAIGTPERAQS